MEGNAQSDREMKITADEVIAKFKDDGDFDTLRLKIIRKLKENEDLRSTIISDVKRCAALNRPGAENLKPRELCDTIHQEIRDKVMGLISDAVWAVIRSEDGMKIEITETVKSVYNKLANLQGKGMQDSLSATPHVSSTDTNGPLSGSTADGKPSSAVTASEQNPPSKSTSLELPLPPSCNHDQAGESLESQHNCVDFIPGPQPGEGANNESHDAPDTSQASNDQPPVIVVTSSENTHRDDSSDEDPDLPPGFG